jgi:hypothetical protein
MQLRGGRQKGRDLTSLVQQKLLKGFWTAVQSQENAFWQEFRSTYPGHNINGRCVKKHYGACCVHVDAPDVIARASVGNPVREICAFCMEERVAMGEIVS